MLQLGTSQRVTEREVYGSAKRDALMQQSTEAPDTPSCILSRDKNKGLGGLYHGGVMNGTFLKKEGITHVVNTAAD